MSLALRVFVFAIGSIVVSAIPFLLHDRYCPSPKDSGADKRAEGRANRETKTEGQDRPPFDVVFTQKYQTLIAQIHRPQTTENRRQQPQERRESYWCDVKVTDVLLADFTLFLVIVGAWQGYKLRDSVDLARADFEASHRPWVSANISLASGITWDNGDASYSLRFILENSGDVPALHVVVNFKTCSPLADVVAVQRSLSEEDDRRQFKITDGGYTIFPGKPIDVIVDARLTAAEIAKWRERAKRAMADAKVKMPDNYVSPLVFQADLVVCVSYRSSIAPEKPLQTGYIIGFREFHTGVNTPKERLSMHQSIYGSGITK